MVSLYAKYEISRSTRYEAMNGGCKMQIIGWFEVAREHSRSWAMPQFSRPHITSNSTLVETMQLQLSCLAVSALTLLIGHQEEHPTCKNGVVWGVGVVVCLERSADCLYMVQLMPLSSQNPTISCIIKSRLVLPSWYWFTQVVPEKRPINGWRSSVVFRHLVLFLRYSKVFVKGAYHTWISRPHWGWPQWNFTKIFGIRKLESLDYCTALFA